MPKVLTSLDAMLRALAGLARSGAARVFLDTETTGFNPRVDKLVAVQLLVAGKQPLILDVRHLSASDRPALALALRKALEGKPVVGHNLKFDLAFLRELGVQVSTACDTMLTEMLIRGVGGAEGRGVGINFDLASVYARYTRKTMSKAEREFFPGLDTRPEWDEPLPDEQVRYMALDVKALVAIHNAQVPLVAKYDLVRVFKLEMSALPALVEVEASGIRVDVDGWRAFIAEKDAEAGALGAKALEYFAYPILQARLEAYDKAAAELAEWEKARAFRFDTLRQEFEGAGPDDVRPCDSEKWGDFKRRHVADWTKRNPRPPTPKQDMSPPNLGSSTQLLDGFRQLGVSLESTGTMALADVTHPAAAALLAWRKAVKFGQSFGEGLLAKVEADGRIHPDYQQIGASTGRMSCRNPNWQQIPSRGDGARMRALVVPNPGNVLVVADFSNIELRILASMSRDANLVRMFAAGLDLHEETARMMFGLDDDADPKTATLGDTGVSYRTIAKTLNYGLVYGMSSVRLGRVLRIDRDDAQALMDKYFDQFPGVTKWLDAQHRLAREGVVNDLGEPVVVLPSGRRRVVAGVSRKAMLSDRRLAGRAERQFANTPIQGTSADITKRALALFYGNALPEARLIAVVHDELVVECPAAVAKSTARMLGLCMHRAQGEYIRPASLLARPRAVVASHWTH